VSRTVSMRDHVDLAPQGSRRLFKGKETNDRETAHKRIALFLGTLGGGGAERVMATLANAFRKQDFAVDVVLVERVGSYLADLDPGVRVVDLRSNRAFFALWGLVKYLRAAKPDAMLATQGHINIVAVWARLIARVPTRLVVREAITISVHVSNAQGVTKMKAKVIACMLRWFYLLSDCVVAPSEGVADDLVLAFSIPRNRVVVIANPLPPRLFQWQFVAPPAHPWFAPGEDIPIVLGVGRLTAQKDFPTLIRAFAKAASVRPTRLMILGEGEDRGALTRLIDSLGLEDRVAMPGFVGNPFSYMRQAAVYVLSSRFEGLPNALLEAMAVATPVIATDCSSGPREILEGGRWGMLVAVGDVDGMAQAITAGLDRQIKTMPLSVLEERYGVEVVAKRYLNVLGLTSVRG
jgi:glycosyltransferase involved in cell wall biosynthesis